MSKNKKKKKKRQRQAKAKIGNCVILLATRQYKGLFGKMFNLKDFKYLLDHPSEVDLVVFTGGEDVYPSLYGGIYDGFWSQVYLDRDRYEREVFDLCAFFNIKMTGICRGFQILNVLSGGQMYQHVDGHAIKGMHKAHLAWANKVESVTSTHHQMAILPDGSIPIAWAMPNLSKGFVVGPSAYYVEAPRYEIEGAIFPKLGAMGVQFHPEVMSRHMPARILYEKMIRDFVKMSMEDFVENYSIDKEVIEDVLENQWRHRKGRAAAARAAGA